MTGWLPDGTSVWGGRPVARTAAGAAARRRAVLTGSVRAVRQRGGSSPVYEAVLDDGTGAITLRWLGRPRVPGVTVGRVVTVEGTVVDQRGRLVLLNPLYRFPGRSSPPG